MAVRRTNGQSQGQGGFCPLCGHSGKKGGLWKWVIGGVVVWALVQANQADDDKGSTDYKPPSQTQTQEKCDPGALLQFGCTP